MEIEEKVLYFMWEYVVIYLISSASFYLISFGLLLHVEKGTKKKMFVNEVNTIFRSIFIILVGFYILSYIAGVKDLVAEPYFNNPTNKTKIQSDLHKQLIREAYK